jgi:hypothetical protein
MVQENMTHCKMLKYQKTLHGQKEIYISQIHVRYKQNGIILKEEFILNLTKSMSCLLLMNLSDPGNSPFMRNLFQPTAHKLYNKATQRK